MARQYLDFWCFSAPWLGERNVWEKGQRKLPPRFLFSFASGPSPIRIASMNILGKSFESFRAWCFNVWGSWGMILIQVGHCRELIELVQLGLWLFLCFALPSSPSFSHIGRSSCRFAEGLVVNIPWLYSVVSCCKREGSQQRLTSPRVLQMFLCIDLPSFPSHRLSEGRIVNIPWLCSVVRCC